MAAATPILYLFLVTQAFSESWRLLHFVFGELLSLMWLAVAGRWCRCCERLERQWQAGESGSKRMALTSLESAESTRIHSLSRHLLVFYRCWGNRTLRMAMDAKQRLELHINAQNRTRGKPFTRFDALPRLNIPCWIFFELTFGCIFHN